MEITGKMLLGVVMVDGQPVVVMVPIEASNEADPYSFDRREVIKVLASDDPDELRQERLKLSALLAQPSALTVSVQARIMLIVRTVRLAYKQPSITQLRGGLLTA